MIDLILPWPPSINHMYGFRGSRRFIKKDGVAFREHVAVIARSRYCQKQEGRLAVFIFAYPPDNRKRDLDNICKATLDALQHAGCYENDCQIDGLRVQREEVVKNGCVRVQIVQAKKQLIAQPWEVTA